MFVRRKTIAAIAVFTLLGTLIARPASAQSATFNFDADAVGTATTFTDINNGLAATFSAPNDPFNFEVQQTFFQLLTGNILGPGQVGANFVPLDIAFSKPLTSLSLDFGLNGFASSTFTITAFSGGLTGTKIGSESGTGAIPGGIYLFPEGSLSFTGGSPFDTVEITSTAQNLAVDNIQVTEAAAVPEASSGVGLVLLLVLGFSGQAWCARRKLQATA